MKIIPLGTYKGNKKISCFFTTVDDDNYEFLTKYRWSVNKHQNTHTPYAIAKVPKEDGLERTVLLHRLIMGCEDLPHVFVDHRDGNGLNNAKSNLRIATMQENARNRRCRNPLGFIGVALVKGRYRAAITVNGKAIFLGSFGSAEEAARERDIASLKYFGEFAKLNFNK